MTEGNASDPFNLARFVTAQENVFDQALAELRRGHKRTHWMWFIFPQIRGLGSSTMANRFALRSIDEAQAYLAHPVLGPRLIQCVCELQALATMPGPETVFGSVDAMKLRSSLTLFAAAGGPSVLRAALDRWFDGQDDRATLAILAAARVP